MKSTKLEKEIFNFFKKKKILITGGTGLIGRQLVEILSNIPCDIQTASLDKIKLKNIKKHYFGDLQDKGFCMKITKKVDFVFHLAGIKGSVKTTINKPSSFFVPLLLMNTNVLEASRVNKVKHLVYTSSIGAYKSASIFRESNKDFSSEPMDFFPGWAKRMAELQIQAYKKQYNLKNYHVVRPCNVYGPGDNFDPKNAMVIPTLITKIFSKTEKIKIWGDGSAIRDFAFSKDVALGILLTMIKGTGKLNYINLGSGKRTSVKQLVLTLNKIKNFRYEFDGSKNSGYKIRVMDISNAKKILGFNHDTSLENGLRQTIEWYKKNKKKLKKRYNYFDDNH
tara:strand:+ start:108 stop:1118 length:1011 start_codon:yes stop_codon:yes gene_type:complete